MVRLFVALSVPFDIGKRLSAMAGGLPGARWTRDENFHLTLRFIGDVDLPQPGGTTIAEDGPAAFADHGTAAVGVGGTDRAAREVRWEPGRSRADDRVATSGR